MDLKLMAAMPTEVERVAVDAVLGPPAGSPDGDRRIAVGGRTAAVGRDLLLPALHALQDRVGWISQGGLNYVCERLTVPPAEAHGVASFYAMLSLTPAPPVRIDVCDDIVCRGAGALELCDALEAAYGHEGAAEGSRAWRRSPCLGQCDWAPAALVQIAGVHRIEVVDADVLAIRAAIDGARPEPPTRLVTSLRDPVLLRRIGDGDPTDLDAYRAGGGYEALNIAIERGGEAVLASLEAAELRGRGGAAFPTAVKWRAVAQEVADTKYVVCNADESEPGTYKDRVLVEEDPFAIVEGLTVAGYVTGARRGYVYLRGEYPLAARRLDAAIAAARSRGLLGADVAGSGFAFDVEIRRGAGAYICGEETSLFNSIEGYRGEPRSKPPFPTRAGLFRKPTAINNVETLAAALAIVAGVDGAATSKLFSVSGDVTRPGLYEIPLGESVRGLIEAAGGVVGGREPGAVLLGGAAGRFLAPSDLELPLGYSPESPALGSGALVVFDDGTDLDDVVLRIAAFFRHESCGQCVPCRVGTMRQEEALRRLVAGSDERLLIADIAEVMRDASICGLGQFAAEAVTTALDLGLVGNGATR